MTDDELDAIEARANEPTPFVVMALVAEVRRLRAERDAAQRACEMRAERDEARRLFVAAIDLAHEHARLLGLPISVAAQEQADEWRKEPAK